MDDAEPTTRLRAALVAPASAFPFGRLAQELSTEAIVVAMESLGGEVSLGARRAIAIELALREKAIAREHPVLRPVVRAQSAGELPPWLLAIEARLPELTLGFGRLPAPGRPIASRQDAHTLRAAPLCVERFEEITSNADRAAIASAVARWESASNGVVEVGVFDLNGVQGTHADQALLRRLPMSAIEGRDAIVEAIAPAAALAQLFSAAHGGAYSGLAGDELARELAWSSLRGLTGVPTDARPEEVERVAMGCGFTQLRGVPFFYDVAWDIGLAVVSPAGHRLAVLCATDTD